MLRLPTARPFAIVGFALLTLAIILPSKGQLQAQKTAVVLLEPQTLVLDNGQISSVFVRIEGAADVYGVQIELSFDAGKIKVLDMDEANLVYRSCQAIFWLWMRVSWQPMWPIMTLAS